jgi:hypothetical protein
VVFNTEFAENTEFTEPKETVREHF